MALLPFPSCWDPETVLDCVHHFFPFGRIGNETNVGNGGNNCLIKFSRSSRSWMISMCSNPRNPQRNPKPSACEVSSSKVREASFNSRSSPYNHVNFKSTVFTGKIPANTMGFTSSKPSIRVGVAF